MQAADVGDDVFHEDPTVNRLEERVAALLGKEAALSCHRARCRTRYASDPHAAWRRAALRRWLPHLQLRGRRPGRAERRHLPNAGGHDGILDVSQLSDKIRPGNDHLVRTRLVCLENTHNRGGGRVYPLEKIQAIGAWTHASGLMLHLDGARLWNAVVATKTPPRAWAEPFDSVSVCFSKGLGAPVGSACAGSREFIGRARRVRKLFGGGMRQAGVLAAAVHYALDHHVERLADDHRNARVIAQAIADTPGLRLDPPDVDTNLIWFEVDAELGAARDVAAALKAHGVLVHVAGPQTLRACTHLDVSAAQAARAVEVVRTSLHQPAFSEPRPKGSVN